MAPQKPTGNLNKLLPAATGSITTDVNRAGLTRQRLPTAKELKVLSWLMKHSKCGKYHTSSY